MAETLDVVQNINIFPLKSAHAATVEGAEPERLAVGPTGFQAYGARDREFVLYDARERTMVTQRGWDASGRKVIFPDDRRLATVRIDIRPDHLALDTPGFGAIEIPAEVADGEPEEIEIFGKELPVIRQGREVADYFSRLLMRDVTLYRADRERPRVLPERYRTPGASNQVAGADGFPFLLTSQASLDRQHIRNGMNLDMVPIERYRGNIVLSGYVIGAFFEDRIELMRIGDTEAEVVKACARCPIPNIDQQTGERGGSGLKVLRGRAGMDDSGTAGVFFGQNLNHVYGLGQEIRIGDPVSVLSIADRGNVELRAA